MNLITLQKIIKYYKYWIVFLFTLQRYIKLMSNFDEINFNFSSQSYISKMINFFNQPYFIYDAPNFV